MEPILYTTSPRSVVWDAITDAYGDKCFYCDEPWDDGENSKFSRTVDHYHSIHFGNKHNWTAEQIHGVINLRPAHRICNQDKANREWIESAGGVVLSPKPQGKAPKVKRPDLCDTCMSGRLLLEGETCPDCGGEPQPRTAPKYLQKEPKECDHNIYHCWMCWIGHIPRTPAVETALINEE